MTTGPGSESDSAETRECIQCDICHQHKFFSVNERRYRITLGKHRNKRVNAICQNLKSKQMRSTRRSRWQHQPQQILWRRPSFTLKKSTEVSSTGQKSASAPKVRNAEYILQVLHTYYNLQLDAALSLLGQSQLFKLLCCFFKKKEMVVLKRCSSCYKGPYKKN